MVNLTTVHNQTSTRVRMYSTLPKEQQVIYALNDLLQKNYDAEEGYTEASENVENPQLSDLFKDLSKQRSEFATKIREIIKESGNEPVEKGSFSAYIHRTWMNIRKLFSAENMNVIIDECVRGEKTLLEDYEEALELIGINENTKAILYNQMLEVKKTIDRIEKLKVN